MEEGPPLWLTIAAAGVAAYGALLSTLLAAYQVRRDRRKLRIIARPTTWVDLTKADEPKVSEILEVRAVNDGHRPIDVRRAGVIIERGTFLTPAEKSPPRPQKARPRLISDGEVVVFYFDIRSFADDHIPKTVWVEDTGDRRYTKRLGRNRRKGLRALLQRAQDRDARSDRPRPT